jgi:sugar phosphate isomerase/epimerase
MRLTVSNYTFEAVPLEGTFAICHSMGFKGVVVSAFSQRGNGGYDPDAVAAHPQKYADHLRALLDKYELECVDFFPQFSPNFYDRALNHPDSAIRAKNIEAIRSLVRFCKLVGIDGLTILPGVAFMDCTQEQNLDLSGQMLQQCAEIAGESGVELYFEPHVESVCEKPEIALSLIERAPAAKFALDYSHFLVQNIALERIHPLLPYAGTFHVRQTRKGKIQSRYNEGIIDFVDIIQRLKTIGYDGCLTIEYICADWYGGNELDTLSETMTTKAALEPYVSV